MLDKRDYPGFNEETGIMPGEDEPGSDEDIEVDLVEDEPMFLRGQTKVSLSHSPVKIVKVRNWCCRDGHGYRCGFVLLLSEP